MVDASTTRVPTVTSTITGALGPTSRRVWMWHRLNPGSAAYNVIRTIQIDGDVDINGLREAMIALGARHEALRCRVAEPSPGEPVAIVPPDVVIELTIDTLEDNDPHQGQVDAALRAVAVRPFDLERGPLWRIGIVRSVDRSRTWLVLALHHVIADLRATDIVLRELANLYASSVAGTGDRSLVAAPSLLDHFEHDRATLATTRYEDDLAWWAEHLRGSGVSPPVPFVPAPPQHNTTAGVVRTLVLTADESATLAAAARTHRVTPATFALAATATVVHAWVGSPGEQVIGIPSARRTRSSDEELVGFLLDTFALRLTMPVDASFAELCSTVRDGFLDAAEHSLPPYDHVLRRLDVTASGAPSQLIRIWFNDLSTAVCPPQFGPAPAQEWDLPPFGALFDVNLYLGRLADGRLRLHLVTPPPGMSAPDADAFLEQVHAVLMAGCARPEEPVHVPYTTITPTPPEQPETRVPTDPVRWWRDRSPDALALTDEHGSLDYRQLDAAVDATTLTLEAHVGRRVVLPARRDRTFVVRLLACRRAGAHPVLVDAKWPTRRQQAAATTVGAIQAFLDSEDEAPSLPPAVSTLKQPPRPRHVLFTSGSTREPLPVEVDSDVVDHELGSLLSVIDVDANDRFAFLGGAAHDVGLRDVLLAFSVGGTLCVPPPSAIEDPGQVAAWLDAHRVTVINTTPVLLGLVLRLASHNLPTLRLVISAGAPLSLGTLEAIRGRAPYATVLNGYGCTETPQLVTAERFPPGTQVPHVGVSIGAPLPGRRVEVRAHGDAAGVGIPGEIHIAEPGIAQRYLGRGAPDRFRTDEHGVRWFHTGDIARWDGTGRLHLVGRTDRQVLVNGYRVLLDEVEATARSIPGVAEAAAALVSSSGPNSAETLELWIQPIPDAELTEQSVRTAIGGWLAPPVLPRVILADRLPTSNNHKVLAPTYRHTDGPVPTMTSADLVLSVAQRVAGNAVDPDVTFFAAGFTSAMLLQLTAELEQEFGRTISVTLPFEHPTPRALADKLAHVGTGVANSDDRPAVVSHSGQASRRQSRRNVRKLLQGDESAP